MAKEKEPKAHQLYKQCGVAATKFLASGSTISGTGWDVLLESASALILINRQYIDLAGWSKQELTTFTQGVDVQKERIPVKAILAQGGARVEEWDYVTTRKIQDDELTLPDFLGAGSMPGFLNNSFDLMEVIYGERMEYASNVNIPGSYIQVSGETFGSGNPTAMDKLHWTRIFVIWVPAEDEVYRTFSTNLIVQALTVEEKDLVWMERLRRSYVLQDQADV